MKEFNCIFDAGIIIKATNIEMARRKLFDITKKVNILVHDHEIEWEE